MSEEHEWQFRTVWRYDGKWHTSRVRSAYSDIDVWADPDCTEVILQRRRRRDSLDPTPCQGIEDPVWRDWIASDDPEIQGVLISKGMPFRSLGEMTSKYNRRITTDNSGFSDVYDVLVAFEVACPARQHAIKKLLMAGQRGKGDTQSDLCEALDAIARAIEIDQLKQKELTK